jgi:hypothetical protein
MLPLPEDATHVDVLFFGGRGPDLPASVGHDAQPHEGSTAVPPVPTPEPEPELEAEILSEFNGDGRYVSARLLGSVEGARHAELWDLHKRIYAFNDPDHEGADFPSIEPMVGEGVTATVEVHVQRLRDTFASLSQ